MVFDSNSFIHDHASFGVCNDGVHSWEIANFEPRISLKNKKHTFNETQNLKNSLQFTSVMPPGLNMSWWITPVSTISIHRTAKLGRKTGHGNAPRITHFQTAKEPDVPTVQLPSFGPIETSAAPSGPPANVPWVIKFYEEKIPSHQW